MGWSGDGVCGVKLQQQLVYPGMLARMLTLSFTSHLLSYYIQSLVYIPSCSHFLPLLTGYLFQPVSALLSFFVFPSLFFII